MCLDADVLKRESIYEKDLKCKFGRFRFPY